MAVFVISMSPMQFLAPTLGNADPLFPLAGTKGFYLHCVEVANQEVASGNL